MIYNMYDGFYIFGPTYIPQTCKDANGMERADEENSKPQYKDESGSNTDVMNDASKLCEYTLSPKTSYSAHYVTEDKKTDIIVEYTLDNYITITGKIDDADYSTSGYLTYFGIEGTEESKFGTSNLVGTSNIQYLGTKVKPTKLSEYITYKYINDSGTEEECTEELNYIYDIKQKKCYYNANTEKWVYLDNEKKLIELSEEQCWKTILVYNGGSPKEYFINFYGVTPDKNEIATYEDYWSDKYTNCGYIETDEATAVFLAGSGVSKEEIENSDGTKEWFMSSGDGYAILGTAEDNPNDGKLDTRSPDGKLDTKLTDDKLCEILGISKSDKSEYLNPLYDFSAINYYIEQKSFSSSVISKLKDKNLFIIKMKYDEGENKYKQVKEEVGKLFDLSQKNNPESKNSLFAKHKNEVITDLLNYNLNSFISTYAQKSGVRRNIPQISYSDFEKTINNISVFAFLTDLQMGYKVYSDYSFAISSNTNDYVNLNTLKFASEKDEYNHYIYCNKLNSSVKQLTGYRNFEFRLNKHKKLECYYCIVNRGKMEEIDLSNDGEEAASSQEKIYNEAYIEALGRERYRQNRDAPKLEQVDTPQEELIPLSKNIPEPTSPTPEPEPSLPSFPPSESPPDYSTGGTDIIGVD